MTNIISFPKLNLTFHIDPIPIKLPIGSGGIRWYGIIIALGVVLAFIYASRTIKRDGENPDILVDVLLYAIPSAIVCARLYYVVFSWDQYKDNPIDAIKIWEGGIAIYGAIIGALLASGIFLKIKKKNILQFFDVGALGLLIGQAIGRWGNFVNGEAYGGATNLLWGMSVNSMGYMVHPTFLYESLWNTIGFLILSRLHKNKPYNGFTFFAYIIWYGIGRFFIEGLRSDSLYLFANIRISQVVALLSVIVGIICQIILHERSKITKTL